MDDKKQFLTKDGRRIQLVFDDTSVSAYDQRGEKIGSVGFSIVEGDLRSRIPDELSLYDADVVTNFRGQDIARECVVFAIEQTGIEAVTAPHFTDSMKNDGNYLTNDGAAFVEKMRQEGLVSPHSNDAEE